MWVGLFVILLIIEICTVNLVSIWFVIGSFFSIIVSYFTDNFIIQTIVFIVVSTLSLVLTKPFITRFKKREIVPTNLDMVVGSYGVVTSVIRKHDVGEVKVQGKRWSAISNDDIDVNKRVEILSIDGVKLHVREVKGRDD